MKVLLNYFLLLAWIKLGIKATSMESLPYTIACVKMKYSLSTRKLVDILKSKKINTFDEYCDMLNSLRSITHGIIQMV